MPACVCGELSRRLMCNVVVVVAAVVVAVASAAVSLVVVVAAALWAQRMLLAFSFTCTASAHYVFEHTHTDAHVFIHECAPSIAF